LQNKSLE